MKRKPIIFLLSLFLSAGCLLGCPSNNEDNPGGGGGSGGGGGGGGGGQGGGEELVGDAYDAWTNEWSRPGHLYFHYNRGKDATDYDKYCLWVWQFMPDNLEGSLWGFSGDVHVSDKVTLKPMSTGFMTLADVGKEGAGVYKDQFGIVFDVDLYKNDLVGGKTGKATSFVGAESIGFLLPLQTSMDGSKNWTSDGGTETYIDDFGEAKNWRTLAGGGKAIHIFVSTGALDDYSFYAGSGTPTVKINPVDTDTTGTFRSATTNIEMNSYQPATSSSFKDLGVGYQIMVSAFRDSNNDGTGDIRGIIDALDYLEDLGVEVLWLTPIQQSGSYHGYDISDYYAVDKRFGTIEDYRELIFKAHQKGMKVLMDLVLNHTSKKNIWFTKSKWAVNSGKEGTETDTTGINWRNVYTWKFGTDTIKKANVVWDDTAKKWVNSGYTTTTVQEDANSANPSWYRDGESNYFYYGKFGSAMPEINFENTETRKLVIDMAKYWMSFGLDGYRLDAVKHIYMTDEVSSPSDDIVEDVGEATAYDDEKGIYVTKKYDYSSDRKKNVNWWKEFAYEVKAVYPNCFLVGENFDGWGKRMAPYYSALDSQFDFSNYYHIPAWVYNSGGGASTFNGGGDYGQAYETYNEFTPYRSDFINGAFTSNHDVMRLMNAASGVGTMASTTPADHIEYGDTTANGKAKAAAAVTILNPGLSWIYYGDELGMTSNTNTHIDTYGSENCMDIWYRQPFIWSDVASRPKVKHGQYDFVLDDHNTRIANNGEGITYNKETGAVTTTNEFHAWYKALCEIKKAYPRASKVTYENCGVNVMVMHVTGEGSKELMIYINMGVNQNNYILNPGSSYSPLKTINLPSGSGSNIGAVNYSVAAFVKD